MSGSKGPNESLGYTAGYPNDGGREMLNPLAFVAMLGDKPRDATCQDGTSVTVFKYETGTTMTRWGGLRQAVAIF